MPIPPELKRELLYVAVLGAAVLIAMASTLAALEGWRFALRWLPAGLACWGFIVWQCHGRLHLNRNTVDDALYPTLGPGTRVTLLRGRLIAALAGFLATAGLATRPLTLFLPALLYTMAVLGDGLDGFLARRHKRTTQLGAEFDTALDALGLVVAPVLAVLHGKLHVSYLLVSVAFYLFQWGIAWRERQCRPVYALPPKRLRPVLAGSQMMLVAAALWPPLPAEMTRPLGMVVMLPLLVGFWIDWLHVSGRRGAGREPVS